MSHKVSDFMSFHVKPFRVGKKFKSKKDIKVVVDLHSLQTRKGLHTIKNKKTRVRVRRRGATPLMCGGPSTISKDKCKGEDVILK